MKEILLYGEVGGEIDSQWLNQAIDGAQDKDIQLRVNSPGGDVFEGVAIYNTIKNATSNGRRVTVVIDGLAASAASYMGLAASKVIMNPGSSMMIHDPFALCVGNSSDLRKTADALDKTRSSITELYVLKTGRSPDEVTRAMEAETWFTAKEAVEWGLADEYGDGCGMPDVATVNAKWSTRSDLLRDRMRASFAHEKLTGGYEPSTIGPTVQDDAPSGEAPENEAGEAPRYVLLGGRVYHV